MPNDVLIPFIIVLMVFLGIATLAFRAEVNSYSPEDDDE